MYLFDTDHITALDRGGEEGERLRTRLAHVPPEEAAVSVVSYEEQMRGWVEDRCYRPRQRRHTPLLQPH